MTIALGFRCLDSVILGADSEITGFSSKWDRAKIRNVIWTPQIGLATVFSGDVEYALMTCDKLFPRVLDTRAEIPSILNVIEKTIQEVYEGPIAAHPGTEKPSFSLLIAVSIAGEPFVTLIKTTDTAVRLGDWCEPIGVGADLARYIASKLLRPELSSEEAAGVMAYILHEVKSNVVYCGGPSLILALEPNGIKMASPEKLDELEKWFNQVRIPASAFSIKVPQELGPILEGAVTS